MDILRCPHETEQIKLIKNKIAKKKTPLIVPNVGVYAGNGSSAFLHAQHYFMGGMETLFQHSKVMGFIIITVTSGANCCKRP